MASKHGTDWFGWNAKWTILFSTKAAAKSLPQVQVNRPTLSKLLELNFICRKLEQNLESCKENLHKLNVKHSRHIQKSESYYELHYYEKSFVHRFGKKLRAIETEISNTRKSYKKSMKALENLSNQIHKERERELKETSQTDSIVDLIGSLVHYYVKLVNTNIVLIDWIYFENRKPF